MILNRGGFLQLHGLRAGSITGKGTEDDKRASSSRAASSMLQDRIAARSEIGSEPRERVSKSHQRPVRRLIARLRPGSPVSEPTRHSAPSRYSPGSHSITSDSRAASARAFVVCQSILATVKKYGSDFGGGRGREVLHPARYFCGGVPGGAR